MHKAQHLRLTEILIATLMVLIMVACAQPKKDQVPEIPPLPPQKEQPTESTTPTRQENRAPSKSSAEASAAEEAPEKQQAEAVGEGEDMPKGQESASTPEARQRRNATEQASPGEGSPPPSGGEPTREVPAPSEPPSSMGTSGQPPDEGQSRAPDSPQSGAPAPGAMETPAGSSPPPGGGEQTEEEVVDQLDRELRRSLENFDEQLRGEAEAARRERPHPAGRGQGEPAGGTTSSGVLSGETGPGGEERAPGIGTERGSETGTTGGGRGVTTSTGSGAQTPQRVPEGSDDDIVARQLREAAEQESDPELKKRLWEEYRKYKEGR